MIEDGFLIVDKPPGITSHDVVAVVRAVTGIKKVGHTGTLDPFATGVLPLALGTATRLIQFLDEDRKVYDAVVRLGSATDTGDLSGTTVAEAPVPNLSVPQIEAALAGFVGTRMQVPPRYSAVKVNGRKLYEYARAGEEVEAKARPVRIDRIDLVEARGDTLRIVIHCGRGTYARVIAEELAVALGTVGHLEELRRLASGGFEIERSLSFPRLADFVAGDTAWHQVLRPTRDGERVAWRPREEVLARLQPWMIGPRIPLRHLPAVTLSPLDARTFQQSGKLPAPPAGVSGPWLLLEGDAILGVGTPGATSATPLAQAPQRRDGHRGGPRRGPGRGPTRPHRDRPGANEPHDAS
jgi:tRNA pseudouridine55 synthase